MSDRWVINWLFKLQAARIHWDVEKERLHYEGPEMPADLSYGFLQFRWLLHPILGLPRAPFVLWHRRHPGGTPTTQELADLPDWEPIEVIGLPVDDTWSDAGYELGAQGPLAAPLSPIDAALQRLQLGAPRIGWTRLTANGLSLPDWQPPDLHALLQQLLGSRLMKGIHAMLRERPNGLDHAKYEDQEEAVAGDKRLNPRLLMNRAVALGGQDEPARNVWHPLTLLMLGAGSDPLFSLALGFGTALNSEPDDIYMVTVRHQLRVNNLVVDFELADVVSPNGGLKAPDRPGDLRANVIAYNRPQELEGPALATVGVTWTRPPNPRFARLPPDSAHPISFVVGRLGPQSWRSEILLTPRPEAVGGWLPFVASTPVNASPVRFADHLVRASIIGGEIVADPLELECTYAVAAQDIYGRWGHWDTAPFHGPGERSQIPSILAVTLEPTGAVTIDFAWDWSDRSPEFIELVGAYDDAPGNPLFTVRLQFGGAAQPVFGGAEVVPLRTQKKCPEVEPKPSECYDERVPATGWGAAQDPDPAEPGVRFYRLTTTVPLAFDGRRWRIFQAQARGQSHLHQRVIPGWNISAFGPPFTTRVYDHEPPPAPVVPEAPQWASLRDVAGVSRALLSWSGSPDVGGYGLYEATETTLLAALGLPGPDTSRPFHERLAVLRAANLPALRSAFRRMRKELIPPGGGTTTFEVTLPRGSTVMHFYAVTARSHNQVESAWPTDSKAFIAVAVPRSTAPAAPTLEASVDVEAEQPRVDLSLYLGSEPAVSQIELHRTHDEELAASVDTMGPPIATLDTAGPEVTFTDTTVTPGWRRVWYRAIAWSARDDLQGLVEARSPASAAASVLMPPTVAPDVVDLRVDEPGSTDTEVLVSWTSHAPIVATPQGPHEAVLEARDAAGELIVRLMGRLDALPAYMSSTELPTPDSAHRSIARVVVADGYRLYAWVPRPDAGEPFDVKVKMIDPLGRIGSAAANVPALRP